MKNNLQDRVLTRPRAVWWLVAAGLLFSSGRTSAAEDDSQTGALRELRVAVDPRVELLCVIFRLAGNTEYNRGRVPSYGAAVDQHFAAWRDHRVVQLARQLRQTRGISYDACMSMAVLLTDVQRLQARLPLNPLPECLDSRWTSADAERFLQAAREFVQDSSFERFIAEHHDLYSLTAARLQAVIQADGHLEWFEQFFGARPEAALIAVPALLNGGSCYGPRFRPSAGEEELYCVLGVWMTDSQAQPRFDRQVLPTVIHEFCHSYANPIIDRHAERLRAAGEKIFAGAAAKMQSQAYANWRTMLYESLVRACVLRYRHRYDGPLQTWLATREEQGRGFAWIGGLVEALSRYEQQRERYPNLDAFAPELVAFFNRYAADIDRQEQALQSRRPQVVATVPPAEATNADPDMNRLEIIFDRPMQDQSWSLVGEGPHFPELVGQPRYDADRKKWTVGVKLKPAWSYEVRLNSERFTGFRSEEGVPLMPVRITFRTRDQ